MKANFVCFLKGAENNFSRLHSSQAFQPIAIRRSSQHLQAVLLLFEISAERQRFSLLRCDRKQGGNQIFNSDFLIKYQMCVFVFISKNPLVLYFSSRMLCK